MANLVQTTSINGSGVAIALSGGDTLEVIANISVVSSADTAITAASTTTINIDGSVVGLTGIDVGTTILHISRTGSVSGLGGNGVSLEGDNSGFFNEGSVFGQQEALAIAGGAVENLGILSGNGGIDGYLNPLRIANAGLIASASAPAIMMNGTGNSLDNEGRIIASDEDGADVTGGTGLNTFINNGTITAAGNAIYSDGDGNSVENTGVLTGYTGIQFSGHNNAISNSGQINAQTNGILLNGSNNTVSNEGTIFAATGPAIRLSSALNANNLNDLTNSGTISGRTGVITFYGYGNALANSGTISGDNNVILLNASTGSNHIYNSGEILGRGVLSYAISCNGAGTLNLVNAGHIVGDVFFGSSNDTYDGSDGKMSGIVWGNAGNDTLIGGTSSDKLDTGSGSDTVSGAGGDDLITTGSGNFDATDRIDGGDGKDTLLLTGTLTLTLQSDTISNIEIVKLTDGFNTKITAADDNVAAGETLTVNATGLTSSFGMTFNGSAESDGRFTMRGGAGKDVFTGGDGGDALKGNVGNDSLTGRGGADLLDGGTGNDVFLYKLLGDSTSTDHDKVVGFDPATDKFDFTFAVTGVDAAVSTGVLRSSHFDSDLSAAIGAGQLAANHAVVFTASSGNEHGHVFLIVDANGIAGYQDSQDYVIQLKDPISTALSTANFI